MTAPASLDERREKYCNSLPSDRVMETRRLMSITVLLIALYEERGRFRAILTRTGLTLFVINGGRA